MKLERVMVEALKVLKADFFGGSVKALFFSRSLASFRLSHCVSNRNALNFC